MAMMDRVSSALGNLMSVGVAIGAIHLASYRLQKIHRSASALPPPSDTFESGSTVPEPSIPLDATTPDHQPSQMHPGKRAIIVVAAHVLSAIAGIVIMVTDHDNIKSGWRIIWVILALGLIFGSLHAAVEVLKPQQQAVMFGPSKLKGTKSQSVFDNAYQGDLSGPSVNIVTPPPSLAPLPPLYWTLLVPVLSVAIFAGNRFGYTDINSLWLGAVVIQFTQYQRLSMRLVVWRNLVVALALPAFVGVLFILIMIFPGDKGEPKKDNGPQPSQWLYRIIVIHNMAVAFRLVGQLIALCLRYDQSKVTLPRPNLNPSNPSLGSKRPMAILLAPSVPPFPKPIYIASLVSVALTMIPIVLIVNFASKDFGDEAFMVVLTASYVNLLTVTLGVAGVVWWRGELRQWFDYEDMKLPIAQLEEEALVGLDGVDEYEDDETTPLAAHVQLPAVKLSA